MKCPHCLTSIHEGFAEFGRLDVKAIAATEGSKATAGRVWLVAHQMCPECKESIVRLDLIAYGGGRITWVAYPKGTSRPIPPEVVDPYASDFREASLVLADSAKASAALSRRCLQAILRDKGGAKTRDLNDQIDEVIGNGGLPAAVADQLHAVRVIGNFAAHPMKSQHTGEILDVEPGEAEWNLDVLESMFDVYFVQPAILAKRKADLNKKLKEAGKPEIK